MEQTAGMPGCVSAGVEGEGTGRGFTGEVPAVDIMELTEHAQPIQELDVDLMLRTLDYIKVYENGVVVTVFLDGTEIEYV